VRRRRKKARVRPRQETDRTADDDEGVTPRRVDCSGGNGKKQKRRMPLRGAQ
jgi:hypothetical protein